MKTSLIALTAACLASMFLAATASPAMAKAPVAKVKVADSRYGPVLFDGRGRALYLFTKDGKGPSRCYGSCATAWPPFMAKGKLQAGPGADQALLGTTKRKGGSRQVTYAGQPLYYYVTDTRPGQITCQDVFEFGGTWYVVGASGAPIL